MPGRPQIIPLNKKTGLKFITINRSRGAALDAAHSVALGRPSIQWSSCVFKPLKPKPPREPKMVHFLTSKDGQLFDTTIALPITINWNNPCD